MKTSTEHSLKAQVNRVIIEMSKKPLDVKMDLLVVPKIQRMNSATSPTNDDDEIGLGYHHTLVRMNIKISFNRKRTALKDVQLS